MRTGLDWKGSVRCLSMDHSVRVATVGQPQAALHWLWSVPPVTAVINTQPTITHTDHNRLRDLKAVLLLSRTEMAHTELHHHSPVTSDLTIGL